MLRNLKTRAVLFAGPLASGPTNPSTNCVANWFDAIELYFRGGIPFSLISLIYQAARVSSPIQFIFSQNTLDDDETPVSCDLVALSTICWISIWSVQYYWAESSCDAGLSKEAN